MSEFREELDKLWEQCDDAKTFNIEATKLHYKEIDRIRNFIPIEEEQYGIISRILMLPVIVLVSIIWCVIFVFSTTLFGHMTVKTGEGFLKPRRRDKQPIATGTDKETPQPQEEEDEQK